MARRTSELKFPGNRQAAFTACVEAARICGWTASADAAQGGLDVEIPGSWAHLRAEATLGVRLHDGETVTHIRLTCDVPSWWPSAGRKSEEIIAAYSGALETGNVSELRVGLWSREKLAIRLLTVALFATAVVVALVVALPPRSPAQPASSDPPRKEGETATAGLPAIALGQEAIYRIEIGLLVFYGGLVVLTPFFYGAVRGRIPSEVSARGAKFTEEAAENLEGSLQEAKDNVEKLDERLKTTEDDIDVVTLNADGLHERLESAFEQLERARANIDELAAAADVRLSD